MQVEWNEGGHAPLVQCVLPWWLEWSTAGHHPGLLVWHWVGLVCLSNWCLLTRWMQHPMPCPNSVLLMITACRTGWLDLAQSLWLLLGLLCHLEPCLLQLALAMHVVVVVSLFHLQWRLLAFPNNTQSQGSQVLASLLEIRMVNVMGHFQMPQGLLDHFSHLVEWGCGPQSAG